jgi:hypothetical protein
MTATPYSADNAAFSQRAHDRAVTDIYPLLFDTSRHRIEFMRGTLLHESAAGRVLDGLLGIDYVSEVQPVEQTIADTGLRAPLTFTIQERFMRLSYEKFRNVTFTEWNTCSNSPSELHKIVADIFVQGYYDDVHDRITRAVAVDVSLAKRFILRLAPKEIDARRQYNPRSEQPFICLSTADLYNNGLVFSSVNWFGETIRRSRTTGNPKNRATHDDPFADYEDPFQDD